MITFWANNNFCANGVSPKDLVVVYKKDKTGVWREVYQLVPSDKPNDSTIYFGASGLDAVELSSAVAVSGDTVAVGAPFASRDGMEKAGAAYVYSPKANQLAVTLTKVGDGRAAVTSIPAGIDCGNTCAAPFAVGERVELTVNLAPDSEFVRMTPVGGLDRVRCSRNLPNPDLPGPGLASAVCSFTVENQPIALEAEFALKKPQPDLTVIQFFADAAAQGDIEGNRFTANEGDQVYLTVTFQNIGKAPAGPFEMVYSVDGGPFTSQIVPTPASDGPLGPGQMQTYGSAIPWTATVDPFNQKKPTTHQIQVMVDAHNVIAESDETNNRSPVKTIIVSPRPVEARLQGVINGSAEGAFWWKVGPLPGIPVQVIKDGQVIETVITDAQGHYETGNLRGDEAYYLLPTQQHFGFYYQNQIVGPGGVGPLVPNQFLKQMINFDRYQKERTLRGVVYEELPGGQTPLRAGVMVDVKRNGQVIETVTTDTQGRYETSYLPNDEQEYYLVPRLEHYGFYTSLRHPENRVGPEGIGPIALAFLPPPATFDFFAYQKDFKVHGVVIEDITGQPKAGVTIEVRKEGETQPLEALTTDDQGRYETSFLQGDATHFLVPSLAHYGFLGLRPILPNQVRSDASVDFLVYQKDFKLHGVVTEKVGGKSVPIAGVAIQVKKDGAPIETVTTDGNGRYETDYLQGDAQHYFFPVLKGYSFIFGKQPVGKLGIGPLEPWQLSQQSMDLTAVRIIQAPAPRLLGPAKQLIIK